MRTVKRRHCVTTEESAMYNPVLDSDPVVTNTMLHNVLGRLIRNAYTASPPRATESSQTPICEWSWDHWVIFCM